ncbi:MAG: hypothetical protein O7H41_08490 [Planctomycetota bacterium]|nr:hypothetical protein [Planctomycetota bacterium]
MKTSTPILSLAGLIALMSVGVVAHGGDDVTPRWSLEGSQLAVWDVFVLAAEEGYSDTPRSREFALGLFGHQIDRRGDARFPVHIVEEITYDLALRVPIGKVKQGQKIKMRVRYDRIREHRPIDVMITGRIVEVTETELRLEGKAIGAPALKYEGKIPSVEKWLTEFTAEFEIGFDLERGIMTAAKVRLTGTSEPKGGAWDKKPPETVDHAHRFRFALREVYDYNPEWLDSPKRLNAAIGRAIDEGVAWLREEVQEDGRYKPHEAKYPHGETCLATLTLLLCGADRDDPFILDLMETIRSFKLKNTYEIAIALMAMEAFYAPADEVSEVHAGKRPAPKRRKVGRDDLEWMQERTERLISIALRETGGWGWGYNRGESRVDLSNTQYAGLGLLSAWRCGVQIPDEAWVGLAKGVMRHQTPGRKIKLFIQRVGEKSRRTISTGRGARLKNLVEGGFSYYPRAKEPKSSMTAGGISTLQIVRDVLRSRNSRLLRAGLGKRIDRSIDEGRAWLAGNWMLQRHAPDHARGRMIYYLYSLERAGVLCYVLKVNGHDWFFEGAAWLIAMQQSDGHWPERTGAVHETCFALLFLKRGTLPIPMPERTGAGR